MLGVTIICVGKLKEKYWTEACQEYAKRLQSFCRFRIIEVDEERLGDAPSEAQIRQTLMKEGKRITGAVPAGAALMALCIEGKQRSSEELAAELEKLAVNGVSQVAFVIGGSLGLSKRVIDRADLKISFSDMTFPHQLMRVILLEQIYRACKINRNEPYHK